MNTHKLISGLSLISAVIMALMLPLALSLSVVLSSLTVMVIYHAIQNHHIDLFYWLSFVGQLLALMAIASSFVLTLGWCFNWLNV